MKLADRGLNPQAAVLEDAQTEIRLVVRDGWLANHSKTRINADVQKIISKALEKISTVALRSAAYRSLNAFADRQYATYLRQFGYNSIYLLSMIILADSGQNTAKFERAAQLARQYAPPSFESNMCGVPLQEYARDYMRNRVRRVIDDLVNEKALDPDDVSGSNMLRNRAEMEVRYDEHNRQEAALRAAGVKLVTCSVHADCSDRCYKWQGRVYSLDGTSGTTEDGKPYVPLETATDVYYTTKAGRVYKNGLFGFNCRHDIMPYKSGMVIPHVSAETQKKENAINTRQRTLERRVREQREKALIFKDIDRELYLKARKRAIAANKEYMQFSKDNGRAYYPSRVQLL